MTGPSTRQREIPATGAATDSPPEGAVSPSERSIAAVLRTRPADLLPQLGWFLGAGLVCAVAQAVIYLALRRFSPPAVANLVALLITTVINTEAHRRLTFPSSRASAGRAHLEAGSTAVVVYVVSLAVLPVIEALWGDLTPVHEAITIAVVTGTVGLVRFAVLREWVFTNRRRHRQSRADHQGRRAPAAVDADAAESRA